MLDQEGSRTQHRKAKQLKDENLGDQKIAPMVGGHGGMVKVEQVEEVGTSSGLFAS